MQFIRLASSTHSGSRVVAVLASLALFFLCSCPGAGGGAGGAGGGGGGGGGGLTAACNTLAAEAGELGQELAAAGGAVSDDLQCRLLENQIATIDAGCLDLANAPGEIDFGDLRPGLVEQQAAFGCDN